MKEIRSRFQGGLTEVKEFKTAMTSLEVAEITKKKHHHILRDIKDESTKLGQEIADTIFGCSSYIANDKSERPLYNLTKDGVHQLGARYDAKIRFSIIQRMNQLESKPVTELDLIIQSAQALKLVTDRIETLEDKVDNRMGLSGAQASQIGKLVSGRVFIRSRVILENEGVITSCRKIKLSALYQDINKNLKAYYGVSIRSDIPQSKYEEAIGKIESWKESLETETKFLKENNL